MIRVNLLPYREAQKKEKVWQQTILMLVMIVVGIAIIVGAGFSVASYEKSIVKQKEEVENEINELEKKLGKIDQIKKQKAEIERKLQVIETLNKNRLATPTLLFEIAQIIPERVWLLSFQDRDKDVALDGEAMTANDVSDFMERLAKLKLFSKITLISLDSSTRGEVKVIKFNLTLTKG